MSTGGADAFAGALAGGGAAFAASCPLAGGVSVTPAQPTAKTKKKIPAVRAAGIIFQDRSKRNPVA
jgi:hypothetical protein